jgi:putative ABC transport system permease protein
VSAVVRVSWYRFRSTFRHEWGSYLTIALLLGLLGGLAMGSVAAARRTQSSYSSLLESTNPSQVIVATAIASPAIGNGQGYDPGIVREVAEIPHVTAVASATGINAEPLGPSGAPISIAAYTAQAGTSQGSVGGEYFRIDRLAISAGRAADPARADEFVASSAAAAAFGFHVGQIVPMGFYTNRQTYMPAFGTAALKPYRRIDMRLVGIGVPVTEIITDNVDAGGALAYFTPALTNQLLKCCVNYTETALKVANPNEIAGVENDITRASPGGIAPGFGATAAEDAGKADRAMKPLSIALGVFGGITALAALLIAVQVIGRNLRRRRQESEVLRALGADRRTIATAALIGVVGAIAIGSLLAIGVAVALSPVSPLGPIRPFYPTPGIAFDWTVLGSGLAVIFVGLGLIAIGLAIRSSPERVARRQRFVEKSSTLLRSDGMLGLPAPAATGLPSSPGTRSTRCRCDRRSEALLWLRSC